MTNLWRLWGFCTAQCYHSKKCVFVQFLKAIFERCSENWQENARGWVHFEELKLYDKWSPSQMLQCIFSKSFQKSSNCRIVRYNQSQIFPSLKSGTKKEKTSTRTCLFSKKKVSFSLNPFINGSYNNTSTVKYYIPYLSVLDKKRLIQNLVENLRWKFLWKLFTALGG